MKPALSLYLDAVRFLAAVGVVLGHGRALMAPIVPKILGTHASECVIVFFVLSGFVIRYVTRTRETHVSGYLRARAIRLWSVAIPAIAVTLLLDRYGVAANPAHYAALDFFDGPARPAEIAVSLAFLNEAWGVHTVSGSNEAYWSLGYEVAYYVAFCAIFIARPVWRAAFLALWLLVFGPKIALYGLLWLMGAALYDLIASRRLDGLSARAAWMLVAAPVLYPVLKYGIFPPFGSPFRAYSLGHELLAFAYSFGIAGLFSLNVVGVARLAGEGAMPGERVAGAIRWLAGATFTIYLMHQPLLVFLAAVGGTQAAGPVAQLGALVLVFACLFALAELGERRKPQIRRLLRLGINRPAGRSA